MLASLIFVAPFALVCAAWLIYETKEQISLARLDRKRHTQRGSRVYSEPVSITRVTRHGIGRY